MEGYSKSASGAAPSCSGWTLETIIAEAKCFKPVPRVSITSPNFLEFLRSHENSGEPSIVEGFHESSSWPEALFTPDAFVECASEGALLESQFRLKLTYN
jgi:hypothetical protein